MSESTEERTRQVIADVLGQKRESILPTSTSETVEAWDSVRHFNILIALEEHFGVELDPEATVGKTVGELAALVDEAR